MAELCNCVTRELSIAAVTNDIFTREDAEFLRKAAVLPEGARDWGCQHTAIRDDFSMNLEAVEAMEREFPDLDLASSKAPTSR